MGESPADSLTTWYSEAGRRRFARRSLRCARASGSATGGSDCPANRPYGENSSRWCCGRERRGRGEDSASGVVRGRAGRRAWLRAASGAPAFGRHAGIVRRRGRCALAQLGCGHGTCRRVPAARCSRWRNPHGARREAVHPAVVRLPKARREEDGDRAEPDRESERDAADRRPRSRARCRRGRRRARRRSARTPIHVEARLLPPHGPDDADDDSRRRREQSAGQRPLAPSERDRARERLDGADGDERRRRAGRACGGRGARPVPRNTSPMISEVVDVSSLWFELPRFSVPLIGVCRSDRAGRATPGPARRAGDRERRRHLVLERHDGRVVAGHLEADPAGEEDEGAREQDGAPRASNRGR